MPSIIEKKPKFFSEFLSIIEERQRAVDGMLWFRGCGKASHKLVPSLYRHPSRKGIVALAELERSLITTFRQRSIPFHGRDLSNEWDNLFFMQHYRVPTRLLDWTENPFIGMFFALMYAERAKSTKASDSYIADAVLWILDPVAWNRHSLRYQSYSGAILVPGDEAIKGYQPSTSFTTMNKAPVALYGTHNSVRIVAQRGVFTIFGQDVTPMEIIFAKDAYPAECLIKVIIERDHIDSMRKTLLRNGTTESVVFPDLDSLAAEIRRSFDFEG